MSSNNKHKIEIHRVLLAGVLILLLHACHIESGSDPAEASLQDPPEPFNSHCLISVEDLRDRLEAGQELRLIQVSKKSSFEEQHIKSAVQVYREDFQVDGEGYYGMIAPREQVEQLLSELGVTAHSQLVLYDEHGNVNAARFWWVLKTYGMKDMVLVDGGLTAWKKAGFPVAGGKTMRPAPTEFRFEGEMDTTLLVNMEKVKQMLHTPDFVIIDSRSQDEYTGRRMKSGASRPGRIPGSVYIDYIECLNHLPGQDYTFKTKEELRALYLSRGIDGDQHIISYCHSGVRSALTTFVLTELLGFENVQNYDGSWVEWSFHKDLPVECDDVMLF